VVDLDWVRWRLDRLAAARLLGPLPPDMENDYAFLALIERQLMAEQPASAIELDDVDEVDEPELTETA